MKKIITFLLAFVLILSGAINVSAANPKIDIEDATGQRSELVYMAVDLSDCEQGTTLGIEMQYDKAVLKKVASKCFWSKEGVIADFDATNDYGVWTVEDATDLNGEICVIAFRINSDAPLGETEVTCKVTVKNGATVVGTYTASGTVAVVCEHVYYEWEENEDDATTHKHVCKYCQHSETEEHKWDNGTVVKQPTATENGTKRYTCETCGASKDENIPATGQDDDDNDSGNGGGDGSDTGNGEGSGSGTGGDAGSGTGSGDSDESGSASDDEESGDAEGSDDSEDSEGSEGSGDEGDSSDEQQGATGGDNDGTTGDDEQQTDVDAPVDEEDEKKASLGIIIGVSAVAVAAVAVGVVFVRKTRKQIIIKTARDLNITGCFCVSVQRHTFLKYK